MGDDIEPGSSNNNKPVLVIKELAAVHEVALARRESTMALVPILCIESRKPRKCLPILVR